ncbi:hypothetical protein FB645_001436 [Coemansia sp. IMI 203386]|nr:hypothetical protein FB645_001436 [Coemansia sp. IMI 203386]
MDASVDACPIAAGDTFTMLFREEDEDEWRAIENEHNGPITVYMAPAESKGGGSSVPDGVDLELIYTDPDTYPGLLWNLYDEDNSNYPIPGPAVYEAGTSGPTNEKANSESSSKSSSATEDEEMKSKSSSANENEEIKSKSSSANENEEIKSKSSSANENDEMKSKSSSVTEDEEVESKSSGENDPSEKKSQTPPTNKSNSNNSSNSSNEPCVNGKRRKLRRRRR